MIQTENIIKQHYINNLQPNYFVTLPFTKDEKIEETNVTCFFCVETLPRTLKCVGIEHLDSVDNKILENKTYGKYYPTHIYIFKDVSFDLDLERNRLIR